MIPRLKEKYNAEVAPALKDGLNLDNAMQVPRMDKIVVNNIPISSKFSFYISIRLIKLFIIKSYPTRHSIKDRKRFKNIIA